MLPFTASAEEEDTRLLKRMQTLFKEGEYQLVIRELENYREMLGESVSKGELLLLEGYAAVKLERYNKAYRVFTLIEDPALRQKIIELKLLCLYELENEEEFKQLVLPYLPVAGAPAKTEREQLCTLYQAKWLERKGHSGEPEQKTHAFSKAAALYKSLLGSKYGKDAKRQLFQLFKGLDNGPHAILLSRQIAHDTPSEKSEWLYRAAVMESRIDAVAALKAFEQIERGSPYHAYAFAQRVQLLFKLGSYEKIIALTSEIESLTKKKLKVAASTTLALAHYQSGNYTKALEKLEPLLQKQQLAKAQEKRLIIVAADAAYQQKDDKALGKWTDHLKNRFPNDLLNSKTLLFNALRAKESEEYHVALVLLDELLEKYSESSSAMQARLEKARCLSHLGRIDEAKRSLLVGLSDLSAQNPLTVDFLYEVGMLKIRAATKPGLSDSEKRRLRAQGLREISMSLNHPALLGSSQRHRFELAIAKTHVALGDYPQAVIGLKKVLKIAPKEPELADTHLLLALCYQKGMQDVDAYIRHTEEAVKIAPNHPSIGELHFRLFSERLKKASDAKGKTLKEQIRLATHHLDVLIRKGDYPLQSQHYLWRASTAYEQLKPTIETFELKGAIATEAQAEVDYALELFEKGLAINPSKPSRDSLSNHWPEVNKYQHLLSVAQRLKDHILLLETALKVPPQKALKAKFELALAQSYQKQGHQEHAKALYQGIINQKRVEQAVAGVAKLAYGRLAAGNPSKMGSQEANQVLTFLKEVQVQKNLNQEPLHLEAAIDYAELRASLEPKESQNAQLLALLLHAKQEFTSEADVASRDYQMMRKKEPGKEQIYQAYIMYIDAKIAHLRALEDGDKYRIKTARTIYRALIKGPFAVSSYLIEASTRGLQELTEQFLDKRSHEEQSG